MHTDTSKSFKLVSNVTFYIYSISSEFELKGIVTCMQIYYIAKAEIVQFM